MKVTIIAGTFGFGERQILAHRFQMRMDLERSPKADRRFTELAQRHVTESLARSRAEVIGVARQSFLAIGDGVPEVPHHVTHRRALVPTFGKIRSPPYDPTE